MAKAAGKAAAGKGEAGNDAAGALGAPRVAADAALADFAQTDDVLAQDVGAQDVAQPVPMVLRRQSSGGGAGAGVIWAKALERAFSPARQDRFFDALARSGNVSASAAVAGVSHQTIWRWRRKNTQFSSRYDEVLRESYADLEMRMLGIALHGTVTQRQADTKADEVRQDNPAHGMRMMQRHEARLAQVEALRQSMTDRGERTGFEAVEQAIAVIRRRISAANGAGAVTGTAQDAAGGAAGAVADDANHAVHTEGSTGRGAADGGNCA
ncbi:MAG: hypothetical protein ACKOUM_01820 [Sphingopyxis sp.]